RHQFPRRRVPDSLAFLAAQQRAPATGAAAEASLSRSRGIDQLTGARDDRTRLVIHVAITPQIAGIVVDNLLPRVVLRELVEMPRHELAVVFDRRGLAIFLPVRRNRAHAMRTNGDNPGDLALRERLQILLSELPEDQVVAQPSRRVAGALLLAQDAEAGPEVLHHARKRDDDLAPLGIV